MPLRLIAPQLGVLLDCSLLFLAAMYNGLLAIIDDDTWNKVTGPHALVLAALVAVIVLWRAGANRDRLENSRREKEEKSREARHRETLDMQRANSDKLIELTTRTVIVTERSTAAIDRMETAFIALTGKLDARPCAIVQMSKKEHVA